jgi:hypothetical protein
MRKNQGDNQNRAQERRIIVLACVIAVLTGFLAFIIYKEATAVPYTPPAVLETTPTPEPTPEPSPTPEPTPEPTPFEPHSVAETEPDQYITSTDVMIDGEIVDDYADDTGITFGEGSEYSAVKGSRLSAATTSGTAPPTGRRSSKQSSSTLTGP